MPNLRRKVMEMIRAPFITYAASDILENEQLGSAGGGSGAGSPAVDYGPPPLTDPAAADNDALWATCLASNAGVAGTIAVPLNRVYAWPFVIKRRCTLRSIRRYWSPGGAGSKMRFGIYGPRLTGSQPYPGALLFELETDGTDGTNWVVIPVGITLDPGVYFQAYTVGVASPTMYYCSPTSLHALGVHTGNPAVGHVLSRAYAAMPNPFPSAVAFADAASYHYHFTWWRLDVL